MDVPLQGERIDVFELMQEACLGLIADLGNLQEPVQESEGRTVPLLDPAPCPDLLQEGHGGLEHIGTLSKQCFQLSEISKLTLGIEPAVAQASAHQGPVLACHIAVVVLVIRTGPGEANPMSITEPRYIISRPRSG